MVRRAVLGWSTGHRDEVVGDENNVVSQVFSSLNSYRMRRCCRDRTPVEKNKTAQDDDGVDGMP